MHIVRVISRWFLSLLAVLMISVWIALGMLQATILNRQVVLNWIDQSGAYQNILSAIDLTQQQADGAAKSFITNADLKQALVLTFPPAYLKQQTTTVLNATYDWIDGKISSITFSLPVDQKRQEFSTNLAKVIEPRIAALPPCTTLISPDTSSITCLPKGMKASDLATQFSQLPNDAGSFLTQPLTAKDLGGTPATSQLPSLAASLRWLMWALPAGTVVCAAGFVLLSDSKLRGLATIGRHMFFTGILPALGGAVIWYLGSSVDIVNAFHITDPQQVPIFTKIIQPLLHVALPEVGRALTLYGGIVTAAGLVAWLTGHFIRKKIEHTPQSKPPTPMPADLQPPAPKNPTAPAPPTQNGV